MSSPPPKKKRNYVSTHRKPPKIKNEKKLIRHSHIRTHYAQFLANNKRFSKKRIGFDALDEIAAEVEAFLASAMASAEISYYNLFKD